MMRNKTVMFSLLICFVFSLAFIGCSGPPDKELNAAEQALKAAIEAGAEDFSPRLLRQAQELLRDAKSQSERGDYEQAIKTADFARIKAQKAEKEAKRLSNARQD